jgi:hypothetical protein
MWSPNIGLRNGREAVSAAGAASRVITARARVKSDFECMIGVVE